MLLLAVKRHTSEVPITYTGPMEAERGAITPETTSGVRSRVWQVLQPASEGDSLSRAFDLFILSLILLNVLAVVLETLPSLARWRPAFSLFDGVSVLLFTVEYVARVWSCTTDPRYQGSVRGRLRYVVTPMALVDLLAVAPFYLPAAGLDLRSLRILRLFRFARALKLARYNRSMQTMSAVLRAKRDELSVAVAGLLMLLLLASSLIYFAENAAQPEKFSSIPASIWWGVSTLTTVGYGDIIPVTPIGKVVASFIAILGVGLFALPAGILASGFAEQSRTGREAKRRPHCGEALEEE